MQFPAIFAGAPALLLFGAVAQAAPATPEGAAHLTAVLQTYLTRTPGLVRVLPAGEAYAVTVDFGSALARMPADVLTASVSPLNFEVVDQGGGIWAVTQDQSFAVSIVAPGEMEMTMRIGSVKAESLFNESLGAFASASFAFSDLSVQEAFHSPEMQGGVRVMAEVARGQYQASSTAATAGGVDTVAKFSAEALREVVTLQTRSFGNAPDEVTISAQTYTTETTVTGLRSGAIFQLVAWAMAQPSPEAVVASQPALRAALSAVMPLFETVTGTAQFSEVRVATPVGAFSADRLGIGLDLNGIVADAGIGESISVSGLRLPEGLLPGWAAALVPGDADLGFRVSGFDLAAPAKMLIGAFDLEKPDLIDPAIEEFLLEAFLPDGTVEVTLLPGRLASGLYEVQFQGSMTAGADTMPLGSARVVARGMDGAIAALSAAPEDVSRDAVPAMLLVKGMAKTEADGSLTWQIESAVPGQVLVNGIDVTAMAER
jgi:hypothetical protein